VLLHVYLEPGHGSHSITVPVILRFLIPNVLRAFTTLGHEEGIDGAVPEMPALVVESFTVFGSREKASYSPLFRPFVYLAPLAETSAFAVRVHRLPEAISMGCARFTVIPARAGAEFHGEHYQYHLDRPLVADFLDVTYFFLMRSNLGPIGIGHVGSI